MATAPPVGTTTRVAIATFKIASVASLGLLTGTTLSQALLLPPALLSLSGPASATHALTTLRTRFVAWHRALARTALFACAAAFYLSPRGARHPYLLWTALVTGLTARYAAPAVHAGPLAEKSWLGRWTGSAAADDKAAADKTARDGSASPVASDVEREWEEMAMSEAELDRSEGAVNGEVVRVRVERWGGAMRRLATGYAVAFGMAVVGIWGDGFGG